MLRCLIVLIVPLALLPLVRGDDPAEANDDASFESLIEQIRPSMATIQVNGRDGDQIQMGSGFVVDAEGLIATNFHVIGEGRPFTVEMTSGRKLRVTGVEASDPTMDLMLVRVDVEDKPLPALELSDLDAPAQGTRVLAFGNPLGLRDSVVAGIVSAVRNVEGRQLIQLAMPVRPGNSGGPLVDASGIVRGIINMKSAIDDHLGFAIPVRQLAALRDNPNPIGIDRWVRLGRINQQRWTPLFGATWQERGGLVTARGLGSGFGGRSLCLSTEPTTEAPVEIAVQVRLDDEAGAAGLAFHSNGEHRHYGFYPTGGRLRLTCFKGPSVYSWQVLEELESEHYLPKQWNRLRVRIESGRLKCFVNGHLVIESTDTQLTSGKIGLVKFRDTNPDFKSFEFGDQIQPQSLSEETDKLLAKIVGNDDELSMVDHAQLTELGKSSDAVSRELNRQAIELEDRADQLRRLAKDVQLAPTLDQLAKVMSDDTDRDLRLLRATLLIAQIDNPDINVDFYVRRVDEMAEEIRKDLEEDADATTRRDAMHQYLFEENGFYGGRAEYGHPANSHLNRVIDDREGLPITLSILYMELGRRLGLSIEGVGLPGHFVVKHVIDDDHEQLVDVFERGKLLSTLDAAKIVAGYRRQPMTDDDLRAQTEVEIVSRVLQNLIGFASDQQDSASIHRYCEALVTVSPDSAQARMMRSQFRAMTDRRAGAIADLDWLIENDPPGFNRASAMQLREALIHRD